MRNLNYIFILCLLLVLGLRCSLREGGVGERENPFDPGGDNWSENQAPYIVSDNYSVSSLWHSFDSQDSTGTVALYLFASDPNQEFDTLTHYVEISKGDSLTYNQGYSDHRDSLLFISGIEPDTTYYFRYIVEDTWGERDTFSRSFDTPEGAPPAAPEGFSSVNQSQGIELIWNQGDFDSIIVYRSSDLNGKYTPVDTTADTSSFDTTVPDYSIYYYTIASFNMFGKNFCKDTLSGRKYNSLLQKPNTPNWDSLSANRDSIEIYWSSAYYYNTSFDVTGYEIFRSSNPSGPYVKVGVKSVSSSNSYDIYFADKSVTSSKTYYYKVSYNTKSNGSSMLSDYVAAHLQRLPATSFISASQGAYGKYIMVNWSEVSDADGYLLYRSLDPGTYYALDDIDSVFLDTVRDTTVYVDSLSCDSVYSYYLAPFSEEYGIGSFSSYNNYGYIIRQPEATSISLKSEYSDDYTTDTTITIYWETSNDKNSYIIYRSSDNNSFEPIDTVIEYYNQSFYTDTTLSRGDYSEYYYYVTVFDTLLEEESYSGDTVSGTLLPSWIEPDSLGVASFPDSVVLSWTEVSGAEGYLIFRSSYVYSSSESDYTMVDSISDTTYAATSISDSVYYFRVEPFNSTGRCVWNNSYGMEVSLLSPPEEGVVSVMGSGAAAHIHLTFTGFDRADSLFILRTTDTSTSYICIDTTDTADYYDTVSTGDTYYYTAFSSNSAGTGDTASPVSGNRTAPGQTDSVHATDGTTQQSDLVIVSWKPVEGAEEYYVYRSREPYNLTSYTSIGTVSGSSYQNTVNSDTLYYYRVKAINVIGDGSVSDEFDLGYRRPPDVPDSVSDISVSQGYNGYIRVSWNLPDSGANYNGFIIYRSTESMTQGRAPSYSGTFAPIDTVGRDADRYDDSDISVTWEDGYLYRVSSYNVIGESIKTEPIWGYIQ